MARNGYVSLIALAALAANATAQVRRPIGSTPLPPTVMPSGVTVNTSRANRPPGPAPAGVSAAASGPTSITVSWMAAEGATGYWISRGASADGDFRVLNQAPITGTSFTDQSLSPKTTAYYRVSGIFPDKFGQISSTVSATTPFPPQPTGFAAKLVGPGAVQLSWNAAGATSYWLVRNGGQVFNDRNFAGTTYTDPLTEPGTYTYKVLATYTYGSQTAEADVATLPSVTITVPRWRGRYRLIATGFSVRNATWDHALEVDGKGDEIFLAGTGQVFDKNGTALSPVVDILTSVHGDINGHPERVRAGSRSDQGGIQSGDNFPSSVPWQITGTVGPQTFPKEIWQGDLVADSTFVVITYGLWEWDGGKDAFGDWAKASQTILSKVNNNKLVSSALAGTKAGMVLEAAGLAADLAVALNESGVLGSASDRPIGVKDDTKGGYTYSVRTLSLNFATAEVTLSQSFNGLPGVLPASFKDDPKFQGDYVLYLKLERIQ